MKLAVVVATRPNFIKAAPLLTALKGKADVVFIHTGQHYDYQMSQVFFEELRLPEPDIHLAIGSGTHAEQTGWTMIALEELFTKARPDKVVVFGDVNATLAAALAAVKLNIPVAHIEAGVRSFDDMPEETNRKVTDVLSKWLFTTSRYEDENLNREGLWDGRAWRVGNIMADTLLANREVCHNGLLPKLYITKRNYALLTLHRPGNVDDPDTLRRLLNVMLWISECIPVVFPIHPRTAKNIKAFELGGYLKNMTVTEPLGYMSMLELEDNAAFVMTDSGGVQVETTILGVPCITILKNQLWPVTHDEGTNLLAPDIPTLKRLASILIQDETNFNPCLPELWDGHTAERIAEVLLKR